MEWKNVLLFWKAREKVSPRSGMQTVTNSRSVTFFYPSITQKPSFGPTLEPNFIPSITPSTDPTQSFGPTLEPTSKPSTTPSTDPTQSYQPSNKESTFKSVLGVIGAAAGAASSAASVSSLQKCCALSVC